MLIEQFTHAALERATTAHVVELGRIRYDGTAEELTSDPNLLRSAYPLRE